MWPCNNASVRYIKDYINYLTLFVSNTISLVQLLTALSRELEEVGRGKKVSTELGGFLSASPRRPPGVSKDRA